MKKIIIPTVLLLFCAACNSKQTEKQEAGNTKNETIKTTGDVVELTPQQIKNAGVETGAPEYKEMHTTLKVNGVIEVPPENLTSVSIPMGGYVKRMALIAGMFVGKGSILAVLEDQQYVQLQQDYLTGKSKLQFLEADFNRQKDLNTTKTTSDKLFQQAQNEFTSQRILVKSLAEKLRLIGLNPDQLTENNISRSINLYAPIAGYVTKINVNNGKYVSPTDVLFELSNPKELHASLTVFENDATDLKPGQKVTISTNNNPDKKYTATVHLITPDINDQRSTEVHCDLDGFSKDLIPGTFINAEIQLEQANVLTVPDDAIVKWEKKNYVFSAEGNGKFKMIGIETGNAHNGFTGIKTALTAKTVVTKNAYTLLMKMKNGGEE